MVTFSLESAFAVVINFGLQGCSVREKGALSERFFAIVEILEHALLSKHSQNVSVVQSGSRL